MEGAEQSSAEHGCIAEITAEITSSLKRLLGRRRVEEALQRNFQGFGRRCAVLLIVRVRGWLTTIESLPHLLEAAPLSDTKTRRSPWSEHLPRVQVPFDNASSHDTSEEPSRIPRSGTTPDQSDERGTQ